MCPTSMTVLQNSNYFLQKKSLDQFGSSELVGLLSWEDEIGKSEAVIFLYVRFPVDVEARNPCCLEVEVST